MYLTLISDNYYLFMYYIFIFLLYLFRTELSSNYIKIELEESKKSLYEYVIDFNPPVDNKSAQFYLINRCKEFPVKTFYNDLLFIPHLLPQNVIIIL